MLHVACLVADNTSIFLEIRNLDILFICTGNACRSILAEAIFNALAPASLRAMSAGSHCAGYVHPRTITLLQQAGIATGNCRSKSWHDLTTAPDILITLCDGAATESCPLLLNQAVRAHWSVPDPGRATGTPAQIEASFQHAYRRIRARIEAMLALPLPELFANDRARLAAELRRIGAIST